MVGSFKADFAGTVVEAKAFCEEHGFNLAKMNYAKGNEGMPMISLPYNSHEERHAAIAKFDDAGFEFEHLIEHRVPR